jgi:hypothetical protein
MTPGFGMDGATTRGIVHGALLAGMDGDGVMEASTIPGLAMDGLETAGTVMDMLRSMVIFTVTPTETGDIPVLDSAITHTDTLKEGEDIPIMLKIPEAVDMHQRPTALPIV